MQDPGLLQDQFPGVSICNLFFPDSLTTIFFKSFSTLLIKQFKEITYKGVSVGGIVTSLWVGCLRDHGGSIHRKGKGFFSALKCPDWLFRST
jgi:hypothetical protein